jgi:hypothetical protein
MQQIFTVEGWQVLLGTLLPKLLACQALAAAPLLPFTAIKLLALHPAAAAEEDRAAAFDELLAAVGGLPSSTFGAWGKEEVGEESRSSWAATNRISQQQQQNQTAGVLQLASLAAVQLRPAPGSYSQFFGNETLAAPAAAGTDTAAAGSSSSSSKERTNTPCTAWGQQQQQQQLVMKPSPVLAPPARAPHAPLPPPAAAAAGLTPMNSISSTTGAALLAVGDSLPLAVDVISRLPGPVLVRSLVLVLGQLVKRSWISSSSSNMSFAGGALGRNSSSSSTIVSDGSSSGGFGPDDGVGFSYGTGFNPVLLQGGLGHSQGAADSPKVAVQRWQEGEELLGTKITAAYSPGSSSSSDGSSGMDCCCRLLPDGSVVLAPGVNRLVFQLSPVRQGLYCLKQLRALLGTCGELVITLPPPAALSLLAAAVDVGSSRSGSSSMPGSSKLLEQEDRLSLQQLLISGVPSECSAVPGGTGGAEAVQIGGVTSAGAVVSEVVVASVTGPSPRLRLSAVVPGNGCLPVSCTAWLGVLLTPLHDVNLQRPRLHVQPSRLISLSSTTAPGVLLQQAGAPGGHPATGSVDATGSSSDLDVMQQQQHSSTLSALQASGGSSSIFTAGKGGQHWVYVMRLQQQLQEGQQHGAAAAAAAVAVLAGRWLPVVRGCVDLSEVVGPCGALTGPLLVWMQVWLPPPPPVCVCVCGGDAGQGSVASIAQTSSDPTIAALAGHFDTGGINCFKQQITARPQPAQDISTLLLPSLPLLLPLVNFFSA